MRKIRKAVGTVDGVFDEAVPSAGYFNGMNPEKGSWRSAYEKHSMLQRQQ
jgi:hypothetical protein